MTNKIGCTNENGLLVVVGGGWCAHLSWTVAENWKMLGPVCQFLMISEALDRWSPRFVEQELVFSVSVPQNVVPFAISPFTADALPEFPLLDFQVVFQRTVTEEEHALVFESSKRLKGIELLSLEADVHIVGLPCVKWFWLSQLCKDLAHLIDNFPDWFVD